MTDNPLASLQMSSKDDRCLRLCHVTASPLLSRSASMEVCAIRFNFPDFNLYTTRAPSISATIGAAPVDVFCVCVFLSFSLPLFVKVSSAFFFICYRKNKFNVFSRVKEDWYSRLCTNILPRIYLKFSLR